MTINRIFKTEEEINLYKIITETVMENVREYIKELELNEKEDSNN